tara:strand:- start:3782 stop:4300 length:519 start_codon:yes stop_codon:yes gene_type:complete
MKLWSLRLSVRTPGFQPGKRGSIPLGTTSFYKVEWDMFAQLIYAQKVSDKVSIGISALCLLHCLLFPSFMILLSSFISVSLNSELIHYMLLFLVVPVSSFALIVGLNNHKNSFIFFIGLSGLAILVSALFIELSIKTISGEILLTIIGSILITFSHYKNYKLCDHLECDCHE